MAFSELPPLPTAADYAPVMKDMHSDFYYMQHPKLAIGNRLMHLRRHNPLMVRVLEQETIHVANLFLPIDPSTRRPGPEGLNIATNVLNGLYAGLLVAHEVHGGHFAHSVVFDEGAQVEIEDSNDPVVLGNAIAHALIERGKEGLTLIGERNRRLLDIWSGELAMGTESEIKDYYAYGFGFAAISAYDVHATMLAEAEAVHDPRFGTNL